MNDEQKKILNNFENDIRDYILENLDAKYLKETYDICVDPKIDFTQINNIELFRLYYFFRRRFPTGSKNVLFSRELLKNPLFKRYRKQINKVVAALNTGQNIREYLPKDIGNLSKCKSMGKNIDGLLVGWGIAHLHIFSRYERLQLKSENKNDDKYLLYIISDSQSVFLIDIQDHLHMVDTDLLNIINTNIYGDELQGFFYTAGITPSNFNKTELKELRNYGVAHTIKLDNKDNLFTSGLRSTYVIIAYERLREQLSWFAKWLVENIVSIKTDFNEHGINVDNLDFHLGFGQNQYKGKRKLPDCFIYDKTSRSIINFSGNAPIEMVINILKITNII